MRISYRMVSCRMVSCMILFCRRSSYSTLSHERSTQHVLLALEEDTA